MCVCVCVGVCVGVCVSVCESVRNPGRGDSSYTLTDSFIGRAARVGEQDYGKGSAGGGSRWRWPPAQTLPSGEVPGSTLRAPTGTSWRPVNTPTAALEGNAAVLRVGGGAAG